MGIPDSGVGDHTDLWSEATRLWNEVIRFVLETGLKSACLAETVGSLGDRAWGQATRRLCEIVSKARP